MKQNTESTKLAPTQTAKSSPPGKFERTRIKLISATRAEIRENGDFNAEQVARRSKSSAANFYNHFPTKDEAMIAAYDQMMIELESSVADKCQIERLLEEGVQPFMANWVLELSRFFTANSSLFKLAQAAMSQSKSLRDLFRTHEAEIIEIYRRFIELGQSAGQFRKGDQTTMAQMLIVFTESWNHSLVQKLKPNDPLHTELTQALVRILARDQ